MRAVVMDAVGAPLEVRAVADPVAPVGGVVVEVRATGLCRSDWHAWAGHDDIAVPHVPGHELAGVIVETGAGVERFAVGVGCVKLRRRSLCGFQAAVAVWA